MICQTLYLSSIVCFGVHLVDAFSPVRWQPSAPRSSYCHDVAQSSSAPWKPAFLRVDRSKGFSQLFQSAAAVEAMGSSNSTTSAASANSTGDGAPASVSSSSTERLHRKYDMPWGELQEWAMKDHLAKYTVQVHIEEDGRDTLQVYTLWRTLSNDVTALSGYPLKFLVDRYQDMREEIQIETNNEILPYIDGFAFEPDGGVSGRAYGIAGVAKGTRIHTTPVAGVESTLQQGYILTQEGIVYELGLPASGSSKTNVLDERTSKMAQRAASSIQSAASDVPLADVVENQDLTKLGALTAIVISGAWAMEALSHHLTVNVFWV